MPLLRELDPDLVFLQELTGRLQLRQLERELRGRWSLEISPGGTRRVAALARRGELTPIDLSGTARRVLGVEYRGRDLPPVLAVGIHADAFSSEDRNREIGATTDALLGRPGPPARLLLGDLGEGQGGQRGDGERQHGGPRRLPRCSRCSVHV